MAIRKWRPRGGEQAIPFDPDEERRYRSPGRGEKSIYERYAWPQELRRGRNVGGCFAEVVARAYFEAKGFRVLLSAPEYPGGRGYLLFHYRQKRLAHHEAFKRMQKHFPGVDLDALAEKARTLKREHSLSGGGGDPDLFVYEPGSGRKFFVEVKHRDELLPNQHLCFRLIERELCPVILARLEPKGPTK